MVLVLDDGGFIKALLPTISTHQLKLLIWALRLDIMTMPWDLYALLLHNLYFRSQAIG
jgi:hypothetical protein